MSKARSMVQYWGGCPQTPNSKWQRFLHLIQRCAERGWRTYLVWSKMPDDPGLWRPFIDCGCQIVLQPRPSRNFDWRCVLGTYRMLRRIRCDILHCHNVHTSPLIAAALAGVPVRIWSKLAMSPYYERGMDPTGLHRHAPSVRVSCALAHRVCAVSKAVRGELISLGVAATKVTVAPGPIDVERFARASPNGVREGLGLNESDIMVTTVGRAVPVKGWDVLMRAFAVIVDKVRQARLVLVGSADGPDESVTFRELQSLADRLHLEGKTCFAGQRGDIPHLLAASDIFVLPSRSEGHPNALKEALAAGLPCIAARVGGVAELIAHRDNGLLFDREDVKALTGALMEVIRSPSLRRRLAERGQASVRPFGLEEYTSGILASYDDLFKE